MESSISSVICRHNSVDFLLQSGGNDYFADIEDERFTFNSENNLNSLLRPHYLDRPKSLDCLHRHTKSDSITYDNEFAVSLVCY